MTPSEITAILMRLDHQDEAIGEIKSTVHEVLSQAKETNGRVTKLERSRAIDEAVALDRQRTIEDHRRRRQWMPPAIVGLVGVSMGAVLEKILS